MNTILSVPPLKSYYQPSFQSCLSLNPAIPRFPFCLFIVPFFSKFHWCLSGPVCFFLFVRSLHYFLTFLPDVSLCLSFLPFLFAFPSWLTYQSFISAFSLLFFPGCLFRLFCLHILLCSTLLQREKRTTYSMSYVLLIFKNVRIF